MVDRAAWGKVRSKTSEKLLLQARFWKLGSSETHGRQRGGILGSERSSSDLSTLRRHPDMASAPHNSGHDFEIQYTQLIN